MNKQEVAAYVINETVNEAAKVDNLKVIDKNSLFYVRFDTTLQDFNVLNRNKRVYKGQAMIPALNAEHIIELENNKSWFGEAGHPMTDDIKRVLTIDPKLVSHKIVSHTVTNELCKATVETACTGFGEQMTKHIIQGMEPAFSLRALAPLVKRGDGSSVVEGKAHVVAYDWVILPSHKSAYRDKSKPIETIVKSITENGNTYDDSTAMVVEESMLKDFIAMESVNTRVISNVCEVALDSMQLSKDFRHVILKESGRTYIVPLEDKIKSDINEYMRGL